MTFIICIIWLWVDYDSFPSETFIYIYLRINISIEMYLLFKTARDKRAKRSFQQRNNRVTSVWVSFTLLNLHRGLSRRFSNMNNNSLAARKISVRLFFRIFSHCRLSDLHELGRRVCLRGHLIVHRVNNIAGRCNTTEKDGFAF